MAVINKCVHLGLRPLSLAPVNSDFHRILNQPSSVSLLNKPGYYPNLGGNITVRWKLPNLDIKWKWPNVTKQKGTLGVRRCKVKGWFREDGDWVSSGTILAKQLGLLYFPGLNVGLGRNRNLYALEHGRVMITTERVCPKWDKLVLQHLYGQYAETNTPIYKTYFHVITTPMPQTFKLTHQI